MDEDPRPQRCLKMGSLEGALPQGERTRSKLWRAAGCPGGHVQHTVDGGRLRLRTGGKAREDLAFTGLKTSGLHGRPCALGLALGLRRVCCDHVVSCAGSFLFSLL